VIPGSLSTVDIGGQTPFLIEEDFFIATPIFQTSSLPLFIQVNFFPADVAMAPAFEHFAPALVTALAGAIPNNDSAIRSAVTLRISRY
jgi:hypothetical protein